MLFLKQSTAVTLMIGPFIDDTDGKTAEVGLTEHPADILLSKNGGAFAAKNEAANCAHDNLGWYSCPIDITDTNTLGRLQLHCHEAGFLPVFHEYMVLHANIYDSLILGPASDYLDANTITMTNIDFGAAMKTSLEAAVDAALENDIPAVPTAGSINDVLNDLDTKLPTNNLMGSSVKTDKDDEIDSAVSSAATAAAYAIVNSGLGFRGAVTAAPGANQFTISTLIGLGAGVMSDAVSPWYAYVFRDAGGVGGAPQGEFKKVTSYVSATGVFTTEAFTAAVDIGDNVILLNPRISEIGTLGSNVAAVKAITDLLTLASIADAVHDEGIEGATTHRELVRIISAAVAGKLNGAGTGTQTFRDVNDSANRIVATVDVVNNRTNMVLTP